MAGPLEAPIATNMKDQLTGTLEPSLGERRFPTGLPVDLLAVIVGSVVAFVLLAVLEVTSPALRAAVGLPLLLFAPGYALVSALFPRSRALEEGDSAVLGQTTTLRDGERLALAFGLSVAALPLLGLTMAAASITFRGPAVTAIVTGFVIGTAAVAAGRRLRLSPRDRYRLRLGDVAFRDGLLTGSVVHTAVNVVLIASVLIALTSVGYAFVSPQQGEQYTDLRLLADDDDELAGEYPTDLEPNESVSFAVAVENQEGDDREYTAVIQEQWVDDGTVIDRTDLEELEYSVDDGEAVTETYEGPPDAESGTVRIAVLLYDDSVPETPTTDNAYRYGYVWVDIEDDPFDD